MRSEREKRRKAFLIRPLIGDLEIGVSFQTVSPVCFIFEACSWN